VAVRAPKVTCVGEYVLGESPRQAASVADLATVGAYVPSAGRRPKDGASWRRGHARNLRRAIRSPTSRMTPSTTRLPAGSNRGQRERPNQGRRAV